MVFQTRPAFQIQLASSESSENAKHRLQLKPQNFRLKMSEQHFSPAAPFASISSSIFSTLGKPGTGANKRAESHTGIDFPSEVCHNTKPCPWLGGLGVRAKKILGLKNINVYALGIYVDGAGAKRALASKYKGQAKEELLGSQELLDDVVASTSFEKTLRLVISFGALKRGQFLDALEERLAPRLQQAKEEPTLQVFKKQFDNVTFQKGLEIVFVQEGNKLVTKVDGKQAGAIASPALCRAIFDIYLGKDAVAPDAKATFGSSLATVLKS